MRKNLIVLSAAFCFGMVAAGASPVVAADFTDFRAACLNSGSFLVGPGRHDKDAGPVLAALCPCLEYGFSGKSQDEIDALAAELRAGNVASADPAYTPHPELQSRATGVLGACFSSAAVAEAARGQGL